MLSAPPSVMLNGVKHLMLRALWLETLRFAQDDRGDAQDDRATKEVDSTAGYFTTRAIPVAYALSAEPFGRSVRSPLIQ